MNEERTERKFEIRDVITIIGVIVKLVSWIAKHVKRGKKSKLVAWLTKNEDADLVALIQTDKWVADMKELFEFLKRLFKDPIETIEELTDGGYFVGEVLYLGDAEEALIWIETFDEEKRFVGIMLDGADDLNL